jgi:hypothetical protein
MGLFRIKIGKRGVGILTPKFVLLSLGVFLILVACMMFFKFFIVNEDSWIKDDRGVYVKHGNPSELPQYVIDQQDILSAANEMYLLKKLAGMNFSSQCLGTFRDYAVDMVHNPRIPFDDTLTNQCEEFYTGKVGHFIELDLNGKVVRIK